MAAWQCFVDVWRCVKGEAARGQIRANVSHFESSARYNFLELNLVNLIESCWVYWRLMSCTVHSTIIAKRNL